MDALRIAYESYACEYFGKTLQVIQALRMASGSYSDPKVALGWVMWRRGAV